MLEKYLDDDKQQIWARIAFYAFLGVATALASLFLKRYFPDEAVIDLSASAVESVLNILASSMLGVTTFSLGIMTSAYAATAGSASPRTTALLQRDTTAQHIIATFVGAFIFSLVGIATLKTGIYGGQGRFLLFIATIFVISIIVINLVRWISHLTFYGRLGDTIDRVEEAATKALMLRREAPFLGGHPLDAASENGTASAIEFHAVEIGYIRKIDMQSLQDCAEKHGLRLRIFQLPGAFVDHRSVLGRIVPDGDAPSDEVIKTLIDAITIARTRTFDQDPLFGVMTLAEIATTALSSANCDSGTAVEVVRRLQRTLTHWNVDYDSKVEYDRVYAPRLDAGELLMTAFDAIARDGSRYREVLLTIKRSVGSLARTHKDIFAPHASTVTKRVDQYAKLDLRLAEDIAEVKSA